MIGAGGEKTPRVTVLMPVYNGARYLKEALDSILGQTFTDFELLVIDDGSTDGSAKLVEGCPDSRVRLVRQPVNLGLAAALNLGAGLARGEYLARMDADDISLPQRLARQVSFMDTNPAVGVCGSWLEAFFGTARTVWTSPVTHGEICAKLLFESVLYHPTVLMRKSLFDHYGLRYADDFPRSQDYELWSRCLLHCRLANIGEVLLHYRLHEQSFGSREKHTQQILADKVRVRLLQRIGLHPTKEEIALHRHLSLGSIQPNKEFLGRAHNWLLQVREANARTHVFPEPEFSQELASRWFLACSRSTSVGPTIMRRYLRSPFPALSAGMKRDKLSLVFKCILHWPWR